MEGKIEYQLEDNTLKIVLPEQYNIITVSELLELEEVIIRDRPSTIIVDGHKVRYLTDASSELHLLEIWGKENGLEKFECIHFPEMLKQLYNLLAEGVNDRRL